MTKFGEQAGIAYLDNKLMLVSNMIIFDLI